MTKHRRRREDLLEDSGSSSDVRHGDKDKVRDDKDDNDDESSDSSDDSRRRRRRHDKKKKKKKHSRDRDKKKRKRSKSRKRSRDDDDSESDSDDDSDESSQKRHHKRKKKSKKKDKKDKKKRRKHDKKEEKESMSETTATTNKQRTRQDLLAQALCRLLSERPNMASELPIMLIRLTGGSTFDLGQMTDLVARQGLESVMLALEEFGVSKKNGMWMFQALPGRRDERVLLRIIRDLLDEVGVTMQAVHQYETSLEESNQQQPKKSSEEGKMEDSSQKQEDPSAANPQEAELESIKELTSSVVLDFQKQDATIGQQLGSLCKTIAEGESISIDGIPDETLKQGLEKIFKLVGLEKAEMQDQDSSDDEEDNDDGGGDEGPTMGFGLPEQDNEASQIRLAAVMEACRNPKKKILGPMRPSPAEAAAANYDSEDDEGPALPGQGLSRGPKLPAAVIKAQAKQREIELKATAAGVEVPRDDGGREEWMLIPGKFDFLSNIKSGQPIKSRGFENKKSRGGDKEDTPAAVHPKIQAEMDRIMEAHQQARGPSLFEQHRIKRGQEKAAEAAAASEKGGADWKWSRDKDLDAGRRVDKDALKMVLGGAADNLRTKFAGGFNG